MTALAFVVLGLVVGSFIGSLTWRYPRKTTLLGWSKCPKCGKKISWCDNIPLLSYFLLGGRCRRCRKRISVRYPAIEATTALVFGMVGVVGEIGLIGEYKGWFYEITIIFFLLIASLLITIAVIDLERMIIPDKLVGFGVIGVIGILLFAPSPTLFVHFSWALAGTLAILFLNFVTRGKGMGLGDAKLVFFLGLIAGPATPLLLGVAVFSGALVGGALVLLERAKMRSPIPFGPFLIFGTFTVIFYKERILELLRIWGM